MRKAAIRRSREFDPAPILDVLPDKRIHTPEEAYTALDSLYRVLPRTGYRQLRPFAHIYSVLTGKVIRAIYDGMFNDPDNASKAIPDFYHRFGDRVRDYALGDVERAGKWAAAMHPGRLRAAPVLMFEDDMTRHIHDDLPHTVARLGAPGTYEDDFNGGIRVLIRETAEELADRYLPSGAFLQRRIIDHQDNRIAGMRTTAWRQGRLLASVIDDPQRYAEIAAGFEPVGHVNRLMYRYPGSWALRALGVPPLPDPDQNELLQEAT